MIMQFLWNAASFIVALGILVTIHEFGHFWVARKLGVKVLRFSVGFGKAIWKRTAKDGTEYMLAMIPLGGYVKMLDEREGEVAEHEKHLAFNQQKVQTRLAIALAGPAANFLLAILVYWWMFVIGVPALKPYLGEIPQNSIAAKAGIENGDLIVAVDERLVGNFREVSLALARRMGEKTQLTLTVLHPSESIQRTHTLDLKDWQLDAKRPDVLKSLGIVRWQPDFPSIIGDVVKGEAAEKYGLQKADKILSIENSITKDWMQMVKIVTANPDQTLKFQIVRNGNQQELSIKIGHRTVEDKSVGFLGVSQPELSETDIKFIESMQYRQQYSFFTAIERGIDKTWEITLLTFRFIGKIFTGEVSPQNLGGPITIAQGAGAYASYGFVFFLNFLGMISVNLGIVNLLPIPVLDGGHILYYVIEMIRGKALPDSVQDFGYRVGMLLVLSLMVFTIFNDIGRL